MDQRNGLIKYTEIECQICGTLFIFPNEKWFAHSTEYLLWNGKSESKSAMQWSITILQISAWWDKMQQNEMNGFLYSEPSLHSQIKIFC